MSIKIVTTLKKKNEQFGWLATRRYIYIWIGQTMQKHDWMLLWWSIYGDMSMNGGGRPEEVDAEAGGEGVVGARSGVAVPSSWRGTARRGLSRRCRSSLSWASTGSWIEGEDVEETRSTLTKMIPPPPPPCYVTWVNHPKSSCKSYISPKSLFFLAFYWSSFDFVWGRCWVRKESILAPVMAAGAVEKPEAAG